MFEQVFKNIDAVLWKEAGCSSELDYTERTSWLLFLKYLDALEQDKANEAALEAKRYAYILEKAYRWEEWAAPKGKDGQIDHNKTKTGDDLRDFVNGKLFPYLHGFKQKASGPNTIEYKIGEIFGEIKNKIQSGYNLREIIDHIDELRFRSQTEKHELSHLYEAKIRNMGNARRNGGEYYTPRPLIRAMVQVVQPKIGERIYDGACGSAGFLCESFEYLKSGNAGNANLPIGGGKGAIKDANREIGVPRVWHSRGYLPHFESSEVTQHVTFHLADSLPQTVLLRLEAELKTLPTEKRDVERRKWVDAWIDAGHGSCALRESSITDIVQGSLLTFDSERYRLLAWVVMPNHVHVLFQPTEEWTVAKIVAAWKKFTARKICDDRRGHGDGPGGPVWLREYWDRYIRDQRHFQQAVEYIHSNPVKAGLVAKAESWLWSSAYFGDGGIVEVRKDANREIGVPAGNLERS
jgi:REP element-mobilizing transposase RayT